MFFGDELQVFVIHLYLLDLIVQKGFQGVVKGYVELVLMIGKVISIHNTDIAK